MVYSRSQLCSKELELLTPKNFGSGKSSEAKSSTKQVNEEKLSEEIERENEKHRSIENELSEQELLSVRFYRIEQSSLNSLFASLFENSSKKRMNSYMII